MAVLPQHQKPLTSVIKSAVPTLDLHIYQTHASAGLVRAEGQDETQDESKAGIDGPWTKNMRQQFSFAGSHFQPAVEQQGSGGTVPSCLLSCLLAQSLLGDASRPAAAYMNWTFTESPTGSKRCSPQQGQWNYPCRSVPSTGEQSMKALV
eukprot:6314129-Amphidinium_carterae.1